MSRILSLGIVVGLSLVASIGTQARAGYYSQVNLVSDLSTVGARTVDPNLQNPWGVANGPGGPFWVSNAGSNTSTLYDGQGNKSALTVNVSGGPTGQVFNGNANDFILSAGANSSSASFVFATLSGSIQAWSGKTGVVSEVSGTGAAYTGLAIAQVGTDNVLFAADNQNNKIDVYGSNFQSLSGTGGAYSGKFVDSNLAAGFSAFNVININNILYVAYNSPTGGGVIDKFDLNGNYLGRFNDNGPGGALAGPWSMVLAPSSFGQYGGDLLVSNNDTGTISAFNPTTGAFLGYLDGPDGQPIINTGIWTIEFGNGIKNGNPNALYFFAGINGEQDGLIGELLAVPEPSSGLLLAIGGVGAFVLNRRRRASKRS